MAGADAFSVVVITYNHAATLPACLAAVTGLQDPPREVLVIDNASDDGSAAVASSFGDRLELTVVREPVNTGFAAAANRGIRETSAEWVLLLNPDCAPQPHMVRRLLAAARSAPESEHVATLTPLLLRAENEALTPGFTVDAAGMVVTPSGRHLDRGAGLGLDDALSRPAWVFGGTAAAALYRRAALGDVAYPENEVFAESFFAYREDAELAWRLQLRGWRCLYVPEARAAHRRGFRPEDGRRGHREINRHSVRNRFLLRAHCADWRWHLRFLPWWLLRDLAVVGACLTVERGSLPAFADLWRLRRDMRGRRRWVLGRRSEPPRRLARWFRRPGWVEEVAAP